MNSHTETVHTWGWQVRGALVIVKKNAMLYYLRPPVLIFGVLFPVFFFLAFKMGSFGKGLLMFVLGAVTVIAGGYLVARPGMGLATLTLFLAAYFLVDGVFEIIWAFRLRPIKGWGWQLFSGIATLVLGVMIWRQFPESSLWAVGLLAGIHMIFAGSSITSVCSATRGAAKDAQAA